VTHFGASDDPEWAIWIGLAAGGVVGGIAGGGWVSVVTAPFGAFAGGVAGLAVHEYAIRPLVRPRVLKNLQQKGIIPEELEDFLEHCVHLIFLRKAGLEYIFIHRLLLERFALWDAPQIIFEESNYLEAIKQFLAALPRAIDPLPASQYAKYRWVLVQ